MSDQKPRVFYVDDEPASLRIFRNTFRTQYTIFLAESVDEAIQLLDEEPADVLITDLRMPGKDGLVLLKHVKAHFPRMKLILLTGYADMSALEEAINDIGIFRYMAKPWQQEDLSQIVENAMQVHQLEEENKRSQELLALSNERLALAISASKIGMWDWRVHEKSLFMSDEYYQLLGYEPGEFEPTPEKWLELSAHEDREQMGREYLDYLTHWKEASDLLHIQTKMQSKKGEPVWVEIWGKVVESSEEGEPLRLVGTTRDVTNEKLRKDREIALVLETEDKERNRMALELHDGIGQNLTATHMFFEGIKPELEKMESNVMDMYHQGMNFLNTAIDESRNMAYAIMPKAIQDFGYEVAVKNLINKLSGGTSLEINFYCRLQQERFDHSIELGLFRVTQECLNNMIKHAKATKTFVQLIQTDQQLLLTLEDNGVGFNLDEAVQKGTMGLTSIKNRILALSGSITIDSSPGHGTTITAEIPYL